MGALALIAGGAWLVGDDAGDAPSEPAVVAAAPPPAKAMPVPPPTALAAAIHDEGHAADTAGPAPRQQSLKDMLSAPPTPAPKASADVLSKALESPSTPAPTPRAAAGRSGEAEKKLAQARIERKHAAVQAKIKNKARAEEKAHAKALAKTQATAHAKAEAKTKAEATAKANARKKKAEPDSDVMLLQALVAHAQAHPEPVRKPSIEAQLKQCGQSGKDAAESCRARVCVGRSGTDAACKPARSAKVLSPP
ncbi:MULTISPECIES: hypothetical protein [unclassified Janthinobacterium]|uniref:hypothetical protein n=1 Tax=unclassified Janthinobacterium TaxID=2610881 RepID=UPI0012FB61F3|nr:MULTISPECIES: hypothetical protein [unclassified Janthinobacterium]